MTDALHRHLLASAERHPDKAVFAARSGTTSYGTLVERAAKLAHTLRALGLARGDRVAILLDGDVDYLAAFYGASMAGGVAVPLCPDTPTEPLVYALAHAAARVAVLDADNLRLLQGQEARLPELRHVLVRGNVAAPLAIPTIAYADAVAGTASCFDEGASNADLAALVYTSGTTGRPKGVMLSHRNISANVRAIVKYLELSAHDTVGMILPFYYIYGNSVLHTHVAVGGTIAHLGSLAYLGRVVENLVSFGCTGLSGVPSTFARLMQLTTLGSHDLGRLRYVTQAGAAMTPALADRLQQALPAARIFVMYGQTEASGRLAYVPPERLADKRGSAGKAIDGVTLRICDPTTGHELPRGTLGEVVAEGENVMLGYFRDPEATARVLAGSVLRTGDLGTMDDEGYLFLTGRESEMIKSGGVRSSPVEIEEAIAGTPGVHDVGVCGVPDEILGESIVAYVVAREGVTPTKRAILDACFAGLPRFKVPAQIWLIDELPRTQTGKLTRRELRRFHAEQRGTLLK